MNNFGKLEKVIESDKPKYLRDALIYLGIAVFLYNFTDAYKYLNTFYFAIIGVFVSALQGTYLLYKWKTYESNFECIKIYTHGLMIDDFCFDYKNIILELKQQPRSVIITFKNELYYKKINISTNRNNVCTIISKIKNYNQSNY